jgi:hypothetical protein
MNQGYYTRAAGGDWRPLEGVAMTRLIRPGRQMARLDADILYVGRYGRRALARAGMEFDGGSKPRLIWGLIDNPWGAYLPAYAVHDAECQLIRQLLDSGSIPRAEAVRMRRHADRRFLEGLRWLARARLNEGGFWTRLVARAKYRAVRCHARATIGRS